MASNADKFLEAAATFPDGALPNHQTYQHPLVERYATKEMSFIWSPAMKFTCWRKLWTALATAVVRFSTFRFNNTPPWASITHTCTKL